MKRRLKHTCGHETTHDVRGTAEEREKRFRWLRRSPCLECWKANRQLEAELENTIAALPPLTGSEAQVQWAERIRSERVRAVYTEWFDARVAARATDPLTRDMTMDEALAELRRPTLARWWIDRRDESVASLLGLLRSAARGL